MNVSFGLSCCLLICIPALLFTHTYYILTASSTIEVVQLSGGNPFFKGERKSESYFLKIHNDNKKRQNQEKVKPDTLKYYFEVSLQNWLMIFDDNPLFWLLPVTSKGQNDLEGIEWGLKTFHEINDVV